nr:MAG TPA: hypothetical protein [Caudoviricetes sp.]
MEILISGWSCSCWPPGWYQAPCFPKPLSIRAASSETF